MKKSKIALYSVLGFVWAYPSFAAITCSTQPTCTELGYVDTKCPSGSFVYCPYDNTKKKCIPIIPSSTDSNMYTCEDHGYTSFGKNKLCEDKIDVNLDDGTTIACGKNCIDSCETGGYEEAIYESPTHGGNSDDFSHVYCRGGSKLMKKYYSGGSYRQVLCCNAPVKTYSSCFEAGYSTQAPENPADTVYVYNAQGTKMNCGDIESCYDYSSSWSSSPRSGSNCSTASIMTNSGSEILCYILNSCASGSQPAVDETTMICSNYYSTCMKNCIDDPLYDFCVDGCTTAKNCCTKLGGVWGAC